MIAISTEEALERLTKEVRENLDAWNLFEIHNELFPQQAVTIEEARSNPAPLIDRIVAEINRGLEPAELVDLWNLILTCHNGAWYEETEGLLHYPSEVDRMYPGWEATS